MRKLIFFCFAFVVISSFSDKPLDKEVKQHQILGLLIEILDRYKIDVLANWKGVGPEKITRTTIAPLNGDYPISNELKEKSTGSLESLSSTLEQEIRSGALGGVVANENLSLSKNIPFLKRWGNEKGKRIFISFTRKDLKEAAILRRVLRKHGYIAFTYLNSIGNVQYSPRKVGELLQTADHVLIIDTKAARKSKGIYIESKILKELHEGRLRAQIQDFLKETERLEKENLDDFKKKNSWKLRSIIEKRTRRIMYLKKEVIRYKSIELKRAK